jgi:tetratricopeptide (TPR) repeat protein
MRHRRGLDELRWSQIALPNRWSEYTQTVGKQQIATGQNFARDGRTAEAFTYLQAGLARHPAHREGRLLFSQLLEAAGRAEAAQDLLQEGIVHHPDDPRYLAELFRMLFQRQEDIRIAAVARGIRGNARVSPEVRELAAFAAATADFLRGNYDRAEDFLRSESVLAGSLAGRLLLSKINWERGHHELALVELSALASAYPDVWDVHAYWTSRLRRLDRHTAARSAILAFQIAHPGLPGPRLELLHAYRAAEDLESLGREIDFLIAEFATDNGVLVRLADFAAGSGDVRLSRRLLEHAQTYGLSWEPLMLTIWKRWLPRATTGVHRN